MLKFVLTIMKSECGWLFIFLACINQEFQTLMNIYQVKGSDIGYHCESDMDCQTGNGGQYSKCNTLSAVCVCTHDYRGYENKIELSEDYQTCNHINDCNKDIGCYLKCIHDEAERDQDNYNCEAAIFCGNHADCSVGCSQKELWRWDTNKDWYGKIVNPLVSDFIPDIKTTVCYDPDRAMNSLPKELLVKTSDILGAGLGVFAEEYLPRGTLFGPYKGIKVYDENYNENMSWTIKTSNSEWKVDGRDKSFSNWIRYVNSANHVDSQNLAPICHEGEIYYFAFKSIQAGSELLVWYGDGYAAKLGIKKHKRIRYTYGQDGYIGGRCLSGQSHMYGVRCYIENAVCLTVVCLCKNGSHARGGQCILDETAGGRCHGKNGDVCLRDENAVCWNGICVCDDNSSQLDNKCIHDETYGGRCVNWNRTCALDRNAECVHSVCECKHGTSEVSGKCVTDGSLGGVCTTGQCEGENVVCSINTQICICETGYLEKGGQCVKDIRKP